MNPKLNEDDESEVRGFTLLKSEEEEEANGPMVKARHQSLYQSMS